MSTGPRTRLWTALWIAALAVACERKATEPPPSVASVASRTQAVQTQSTATCTGVVPSTLAPGWKLEPLQSVGGPAVQGAFAASAGERALVVVKETSGAPGATFTAQTKLNGLVAASLDASMPLAAKLVDLSASNQLQLEVQGTGAARASVASLAPAPCNALVSRVTGRGGRLPSVGSISYTWPASSGQGVLEVEASVGKKLTGRVYVDDQLVVTVDGTVPQQVLIVSPQSSGSLRVEVGGDVGAWVQVTLIDPDMLPPTLSMQQPAEGEHLGSSPATVQGQAGAGAVSVKVGGAEASLVQETYTAKVSLQEGTNALVAQAQDACGNVARMCRLVEYVPQPPHVVIDSVTDGLLTKEVVVPTWHVESGGSVSVQATLDGAPFTSGTPVSAEGPHTLQVVATDAAGRQDQVHVGFTIDKTPPAITLTGVEEGTRRNTPVVLGFSVQDTHPGTVQATLDGAPVATGDTVSAEGAHELVVAATDAARNTSEARRHFVLDMTGPSLEVLSPTPGSYIQAGAVEVVASAGDDGPVASVLLGSTELMRGEDGNYRGQVALEEGSNLLLLLARDVAGNTMQRTLQVTRDSTAPQLTITSPADGVKVAGSSLQVEGQVQDATPLTLTVAGLSAAVETDGHFQLTLPVTAGAGSVEVVATDAAGNTSKVLRSFRVNATPPRLDLSAPPSGTTTDKPSITVSGFARAADPTDSVKLEVAGGEHAVGGDGRFSLDVPLEPGINTVSITAVDGYGLRTTRTVKVERTGTEDGGTPEGSGDAGSGTPDAGTPSPDGGSPDAGSTEESPPTLVISSPEEDSLWSTERVAVLGHVEGGTLPLQVTVEGLPATVAGHQFSASLALPEGSFLLSLRAVDALGRMAQAQRQVRVDRTPPYLEVTRPEAPLSTVTESPYLVEGVAGDEYLGAVTVNGVPAQVLAGHFSAEVRLVAGDNEVVVEAADLAGNRARVTRTLRVDGMPPQLTVQDPAEGSESEQPVVSVSVKVEASSPLAEVRIGTGPASESSAGIYTAQVPLALGLNTVAISARDALGLTGTATLHVRYRDPSTEPLTVTGVDPSDQASGLEPDTLVNVSFNKEVKADSVRTGFTVSVDGQPLPGGYSVAPFGQTVSFIARDPLPEKATLQVRVAGVEAEKGPGMEGEFRSTFTVRRPLTRLRGVVVDERREPLAGVRVAVEGQSLSTTTGPDGNWALFGVAPGPIVLRYEGPAGSQGQSYPTVRRPFVVASEQDNVESMLTLTPVDAASAETVDTSQPVHLTFGGSQGTLALDIPAEGMIFADGTVRGTVTATEVPISAAPVHAEGSIGPVVLWQLQPEGTRLLAPVELHLPNRTNAPSGHKAVLFTYEPETQQLRMTGLATVSADGSEWVTDEPMQASSLEFFGYLPLPDQAAPTVARLLAASRSQANAQPRSAADGFVAPLRQSASLDLGLTTFVDELYNGVSPVLVSGVVRGPSEQAVALTLADPTLNTERKVTLNSAQRFVMPISFSARTLLDPPPNADPEPLTAMLKGVGPSGQPLGPPSGQGQWVNESPVGRNVNLSSAVELSPGTSLLTLSASSPRGKDILSLNAELMPAENSAPDGGVDWRLRVRPATSDGGTSTWAGVTGEGIVRFRDLAVLSDTGWSQGAAITNAKGQYSAGVLAVHGFFLPPPQAVSCVEMPLGNRVQSWVEGSGNSYKVKTRTIPSQVQECSGIVEGFGEGIPGADITIDARWLHGLLTFVDREGKPLKPSCETEREPDGGTVLSLSEDDIRSTEVHFFSETDLSQPIANFTVADPEPCTSQQEGKPQAHYGRIRLGPSSMKQLGPNFKGRSAQHLVPGDRLVVFAINHATGYAGMSTVTVPSVNQSTRAADGSCPQDEAEGPIVVVEGGRQVELSHCTAEELGIGADIQLYPPEIEVRVERRAKSEGISNPMASSLVRHSGAATTRDEFVKVSTQWRVRRAPASSWQAQAPIPPACNGGIQADGGSCAPQPLYDEGPPARLLERYCAEFTSPLTAEEQAECLKDDSKLADVPAGVPPLAGRLVRITGSSVEQPSVAEFSVKPGRGSATLQTSMRVQDSSGAPVVLNNLTRANYYVQVVGHAVLPRDRDSDGIVEPSEENAPPPDFSDGEGLPGMPNHAVQLKNVYRSLELDGGSKVERFDLAREHEFRVMEVGNAEVTARTDRGEDRPIPKPGDPSTPPAASPEDVAYQFLLNLLEPDDPGRGGVLSGQYALRLGSDSFGMDCPVELDATSHKLRGTCEGEYLPEVLSASDIVYLEVFLRGNAENVLYRFNFDGLSMREDYLGVASAFTAQRAVETKDHKPVLDRPVSQLNEANFFLGPQTFETGRVRLCTTPDCGGTDTLIKDALFTWQASTGSYSIEEQAGGLATAKLVQDDKAAAAGTRHLRLALPASLARMPGANAQRDPTQLYLVTKAETPVRSPESSEQLGAPLGRFQGLHAEAPGQQSVAGIGLADLRLSFTHTDFSVPQYAETVSFARTYNNQNDLLSPLGLGWSHGYDGSVSEEFLGRYVVVLGGQAWSFNECATVDQQARTAKDCKTDKTHGMELEVTAQGVKVTTEYGFVYRFDRPAVRRDREGRRKWLLTKFHDGHGRGEDEGWTHLTYAQDSNRITKVERTPGALSLEFKYCEDFAEQDCEGIPSDAAGALKALARTENFKLLTGVVLKKSGTVLHEVRFKHDKWGNLLEASRDTDPPPQRWKYTYQGVPQGLDGQKAWRAVNELSEARLEVADTTQWLATYERGGAPCYEHLESFECVSGVKQTGTMGASLKLEGPTSERKVTLPDGALARMGLNEYGNVLSSKLGGLPARSMTWPSSQRGGEVRLDTSVSPAGRTLKYGADERMRLNAIEAPGASDVAGLSGPLLSVTSRASNGRPTGGTIATAEGPTSWSMPRSAAGDVKGLSLDSASGTFSLLSRTPDEEGRIVEETDATGNTTHYTFGGDLGLPTGANVSGPTSVEGLSSYTLKLERDDFGRLTKRTNEATGEEESWSYDGQGHVLMHSRAGQPSEVWTYSYAYGEQQLTVVERLQGVSFTRTMVFKEGLLTSELLDYGQGSASRTYTYEGGRLKQKTDERGVIWAYTYDDAGRLLGITANGKVSESYGLDDDGHVQVLTDREGRSIHIGYDALGQPISWTYEDGHVEQVKRDAQGAIVWQRSASPDAAAHAFDQNVDALGRVLSTKSGQGSAGGVDAQATYDIAGRVLTRQDSKLGMSESFKYDVLGRVTRYIRTIQSGSTTLNLEETRTYTDSGGVTEVDIQWTIDTGLVSTRTESQRQKLDPLGRLLEDERPGAGKYTSTYDARGNVLTRQHPVLGLSTYAYDGLGHLLSKTEPGGVVTTYTTDAAGLVLTQNGPHGQEHWTFSYDDFGRQKSRSLAAAGSTPAASWSLAYPGSGQVVETPPIGSAITRVFNSRELLLSEQQGVRTTQYAYDGAWLRLSKLTEGTWQRTQTREFDDLGRAVREGESWQTEHGEGSYEYQTETPWNGLSANRVETWVAAGNSLPARYSQIQTDSLGNTVSIIQGGVADAWTYDAAGVLSREALGGRPEKLFSYEQDRLTQVWYGGVEQTLYTYDDAGRLATETDPAGRMRTLQYDAQGLLKQESFGTGQEALTTGYTYDLGGFLKGMTRGGAQWGYTHGPRGELQSVVLPGGVGTFAYQHDALLRLTGITPPAGGAPAQTFAYDEFGRTTRRTRGGSVWTTTWQDGTGLTTDPNGDLTKKSYDGRGRVAREEFLPGAQSQPHTDLAAVAYAYDGVDHLVSANETRNSGNVLNVFGYDGRNRLTTVKRGNETVIYAYTDSGQKLSVTSPSGQVSYEYDALDRVKHIFSSQGPSIDVKWEPGGLLSELNGNGVVEQYAYYSNGLLHSIKATKNSNPLTHYEYTYDDRGNRLEERYTALAATTPEVTQYGYDQADRLTGVRYPSGQAELYALAGDGSRKEEKLVEGYLGSLGPDGIATATNPARHWQYSYDTSGGLQRIDNVLTGGLEAQVTTDAKGQVVAEVRGSTTSQYGWDAAGRLASIKRMDAQQTVEAAYTYGFDGLRRSRIVDGVGTHYVWGADEELLEEGPATGAGLLYARANFGVPAAGGEQLLHDALGSVVGRVGATVNLSRYGAWGALREGEAPSGAGLTLAYAGQHIDSDVGLSYAQQRWYSPETGRFLSEDPVFGELSQPMSMARWGYAHGNPLRFTDPTGRSAWDRVVGGLQVSVAVDKLKALSGKAAKAVGEWVEEHPSTMGFVKALGGVGEIAAGGAALVAPEPTMVTKVIGGAAIVHGIDTMQAGFRQMVDGQKTATLTSTGIKTAAVMVGVNEKKAEAVAELTDAAIGIVLSLGASALGVTSNSAKVLTAQEKAAEAAKNGSMFAKLQSWWLKGAEADNSWKSYSLEEKIFYEIGQKTLNPENWEKFGHIADPIERGRALWRAQKWRALLSEDRGWFLGLGGTFHTGPTPADRWFIREVGGAAGTMGEMSKASEAFSDEEPSR